MHIAALYIPKGLLPHVFGENHPETTINFGGKNLYIVVEHQIGKVVPNAYYLDDLFLNEVSLLSCVVGSNGGGKTTLLKLLINSYGCNYVIESSSGAYHLTDDLTTIHRVYYTPYLTGNLFDSVRDNGKDLSKHSMLKTDNHGDGDLLDHFLAAHFSENIKRWIRFNHFYRQLPNKSVKLPTFSTLTFSLKHFDVNVLTQNGFHDTAEQLRPALITILQKIKIEKELDEKAAFANQDIPVADNKTVYFPIRFKYDLYETAVGKLISIFERAGNDFLQEGYIPEDYEEKLNELDARSSIEWFLHNAGVYRGDEKYEFNHHLVLLDLVDYITSLLSPERITNNWREIKIDELEALTVINLYDVFNTSFNNDWFTFDTKPMFGLTPHITVSSGEQSFLDLFSTLYFHAENIRLGVDIDEHSFNSLEYIQKDILLLLDEGDNAFHPKWKKAYVQYLREIIPLIFPGFNIQIIITSHDPLTLSDLPKNNVVFLEKAGDTSIIGISAAKRTFGANVSDLLKDSFFIDDGQIGLFAAHLIRGIIQDIGQSDLSADKREKIERVIHAIDEPVLKFKLAEMLAEATEDRTFELQLIDEEIRLLEKRRREI